MILNFGIGKASENDLEKMQAIKLMYERYKNTFFPKVNSISPQEIIQEQNRENITFIDVRSPGEQEVSMLQGAITAEEFEKNPEKYENHMVVTYCTIGRRSGIYAGYLIEKGIDARNMAGGILSWVHNGQKVYNDEGETNRVHVYGRKWNLLPERYEAVW